MAKGMDGVAAPVRPARATSSRSGIVGALQARSFIEADLDAIADNPRNPPKRIDPTTLGVPRDLHSDDPEDGPRGLVASVVDQGVLEPLILISAEAWLAAYPEDAASIGSAAWVAPAGNRRKAAALAAREWAIARVAKGERVTIRHQVPGVVRDDLVANIDEVLLHENSNRLELSPVDEARVYQRLADRGMSQRAIAKALGLSQSQVAKRLKLLVLPDAALQVVDSGEVAVIDALGWAEAEPEVLAEFARQLEKIKSAGEAFRRAKDAVVRAAALERAQVEAEKRGVPLMEDPYKTLGSNRYWSAHLSRKEDIAEAAAAGTLVVAPSDREGGQPRYFTTKVKRRTASEAEKAERAARKEATSRRAEFARDVAAKKKPAASALRGALVQAVMDELDINGHETDKLSMQWCQTLGIGADKPEEYWTWRSRSKAAGDDEHVAWVIILAAYEVAARWEHATWTASKIRSYYQLLQDLGYKPTPWELAKLNGKKK